MAKLVAWWCQGGDSAEGVRQGDPAASLFFSYGMKRAMASLSRRLKLVNKAAQLAAYLDNLYIFISFNLDQDSCFTCGGLQLILQHHKQGQI